MFNAFIINAVNMFNADNWGIQPCTFGYLTLAIPQTRGIVGNSFIYAEQRVGRPVRNGLHYRREPRGESPDGFQASESGPAQRKVDRGS